LAEAKLTATTGDFDWFWQRLNQYLAKNQLKQTKQRQMIVESFLGLASHVDAEDLHRAVRKQGQKIGLATIYRTLNLLTHAGLAEQKNFQDGRAVFEVLLPNEHHDHLLCLDCGKVIEFKNADIEKLQEQVAKAHGFILKSHQLDLYGSCQKPGCSNKG
jgi:Fur family ferric uptake transcriptional regulator